MTKILLVEDNEDHALLAKAGLERAAPNEFVVHRVTSLSDAIARLYTARFDVVLLDLSLPDAKGLTAVQNLQSTGTGVPIVVLTAMDDQHLALQAVQCGAQDYLTKDFNHPDLIARAIRYSIERKRFEERLLHLAHYDPLTGLANRALFHDRLEHAVARARRSQMWMALMFLDLDRFKVINDTLGHDIGDRLLHEVARRIKGCVREADMVARLGGDEFTVILEGPGQIRDVRTVAHKVLEAVRPKYEFDGHEFYMTCSIGIACYPENGSNSDTLTKNADAAMYRAKSRGGNGYQFYTSEMGARAPYRLEFDSALRRALEREEFYLVYQPWVELGTGQHIGMEALIRWRNADLGNVMPADFIPVAEETGLVGSIGEWVIHSVYAQLSKWRQAGLYPPPVSINISGRQVWQSDLLSCLTKPLQSAGLDPSQVQLEFGERFVSENTEECAPVLLGLREAGFTLVIDDFGASYSSLRHLRKLSVAALKIDRSYVRGITRVADDAAITQAIIGLAHRLRLKVIAKGVETEQQRAFLHGCRCEAAQGELFSPPVSADEITRLLTQQNQSQMSGRASSVS